MSTTSNQEKGNKIAIIIGLIAVVTILVLWKITTEI